ncbi:MAG: hypothetical protein [Microvirus sp.]|nr:MAG: hypothetical protein [Microvirus sp.]
MAKSRQGGKSRSGRWNTSRQRPLTQGLPPDPLVRRIDRLVTQLIGPTRYPSSYPPSNRFTPRVIIARAPPTPNLRPGPLRLPRVDMARASYLLDTPLTPRKTVCEARSQRRDAMFANGSAGKSWDLLKHPTPTKTNKVKC